MKPPITDFRGKLPTNGTFPQRTLGQITLLAVHYQGADTDASTPILDLLTQDANFHIGKNWCRPPEVCHGYGIEYHYAADDDGIYQLNDETAVTWNDTNANVITLAIICPRVGPNTPPGPKTLANVQAWLDWVTTERPEILAGRPDVFGHGELVEYGNSTSCPGDALLAWVQAYRAGKPQPVQPASSVNDQLVTILSVIGDATYRQPVNLTQIQVLVQQGKALLNAK